MQRFKDKVVLITGSAKGIGRATALMFAKEGAKVIINYLSSEDKANKLIQEISGLNSEAIAIKCDVSKENEVVKMVETSIEKFGKIDILVNNAGIAHDADLFEKTTVEWNQTLNVNLLGQFLCSKYCSKVMLKNGYGKIINISSTSAFYSFSPDIIDYDVSKAGVVALTKDLSKKLAPKIQVNAIVPGWVNTDINKDLPNDFISNEINQIYMKRFAEPEEIAHAILFMASDEASFITGTTLIVDGGHD